MRALSSRAPETRDDPQKEVVRWDAVRRCGRSILHLDLVIHTSQETYPSCITGSTARDPQLSTIHCVARSEPLTRLSSG